MRRWRITSTGLGRTIGRYPMPTPACREHLEPQHPDAGQAAMPFMKPTTTRGGRLAREPRRRVRTRTMSRMGRRPRSRLAILPRSSRPPGVTTTLGRHAPAEGDTFLGIGPGGTPGGVRGAPSLALFCARRLRIGCDLEYACVARVRFCRGRSVPGGRCRLASYVELREMLKSGSRFQLRFVISRSRVQLPPPAPAFLASCLAHLLSPSDVAAPHALGAGV